MSRADVGLSVCCLSSEPPPRAVSLVAFGAHTPVLLAGGTRGEGALL